MVQRTLGATTFVSYNFSGNSLGKKVRCFYSCQNACFDERNKDLKRFDENTEDVFIFVGILFSCHVWHALMVV
jgi:hypothetical protein